MYSGKPKTNSNILWHRPQSTTCRVEDELMQKSVRALAHTTDPLEKLRLLCLSRGAAGIMALGRILRHMDEDCRKQISKEQFFKCIKETGLDVTIQDADSLFKKFDPEETGYISVDEFIREIRPPMSESRRSIVEHAFKKLDKSGEGVIKIHDLRALYSPNSHPSYMSGEDSADAILDVFLANFETEGVDDCKVTLEEFMNFYSGISVSIEQDGYFDLMMRQEYKL